MGISLFALPKAEKEPGPGEHPGEEESVMNQYGYEYDTFTYGDNTLTISFIGHGTLMMEMNDIIIHIDPVSREGNYDDLPDGDLILITHGHGDHLDTGAIKKIQKENTVIIGSEECIRVVKEGIVLKNGEETKAFGITVTAIPAYNTTAGRDKFHPKGRDNGYILDLNGKRIYIAGDTEDTPEMLALTGIDIAFLPMNQPYTMTPEQAARAARGFKPEILYPYHFGKTDTDILVSLLKDEPEIEVRIRDLE
jgi:L-ascorbate metabolism protein UlaG (beta-lactamase superfamily)